MHKGLIHKGLLIVLNLLLVAAVIGLVGGVAWQNLRNQSDHDTAANAGVDGELTSSSAQASTGSAETTAAAVDTSGLPRLLDLGADKCKACKEMAPILEQLKGEYEGRAVVEFVDVWKNGKVAKEHGVSSIPTQIFFDREGKEVWRHVGFLAKEQIVAKFTELGVQ